jgi:hypothetical protein
MRLRSTVGVAIALVATAAATAERPTLSGPEYTFVSDQGWFRVHWTDSGPDSTSLAYAGEVAAAADSSRTVEVGELGFLQPPSDQGLGGDDLYDIYLLELSGDTEGYVSTAGEPGDPSTPNNDSASHMVMDTGIDDVEERRCLVAGLFQLACQAAADVDEAAWLGENCSVWVREEVYPDYDCYLTPGGDGSIAYPWRSVPSSAGMEGSFSWAWFIEDRLGSGSVAEVWDRCAEVSGPNTWQACQDVFATHGIDFAAGFMEYGMWRFLTDSYWLPGWGFGGDARYWEPGPSILDEHLISSLPDSANWSGNDQTAPGPWGLNWIRVDLADYQEGWVEMDFDGADGLQWGLGVIMWRPDACELYHYDVPQPSGEMSVWVCPAGWDYAVFFPARQSGSGGQGVFRSCISHSTGSEGGEGPSARPSLKLSGNPLGASSRALLGLPAGGRAVLSVYDLAGRRVATPLEGELAGGSHSLSLGGLGLPPGTYALVLSAPGGACVRKAVVAP